MPRRTGGDRFTVRIAEVDLGNRRMELVVIGDRPGKRTKGQRQGQNKPKSANRLGRRGGRGRGGGA